MSVIHKFQPDRTIALGGFDDRGAGASMTGASASGFTVSGVFRAAGDFCTLYLFDADDFYGHPRFKYLPSFDLSGVTLQFDVAYTNLQPLDSAKSPWIAWDVLSYIDGSGMPGTVPLFAHASQVGGTYAAASATFTVSTPGAVAYDRVTLLYQNYAFDYIASGGESASDVAMALVAQVNAISWGAVQSITASHVGGTITITAGKPGRDGNMIRLYCQFKNSNLTLTAGGADYAQLAGGSSAATWRVTLDFSALSVTSVRQCWITFAPPLADSAAAGAIEWSAVFSNWTVTGANKALQVAGPGSVRVEDSDLWCQYTGTSWGVEAGFFSKGFAKRATVAGDAVTVSWTCQSSHDLYIGTSLYSDRGKWNWSLDGTTTGTLDCHLGSLSAVVTRRLIAAGLQPGTHSLTLTADGSGPVYFDFLEAVVASDVPDPATALANIRPANDYGTDHTYKLPPARIQWMHEQLGFGAAPWNVYVSVFWHNQRVRSGAAFPAVTLDFSQTSWTTGCAAFINIGGLVLGKSVFPADDAISIARHFAYLINETAVGVWASVSGSVLTITLREVGSSYSYSFSATKEVPGPVDTALTFTGSLSGGTYGTWVIDPSASPTLNKGTRDWLADLCAVAAAASVDLTLSYSMEMLNPPDNPPSAVWAARFPDGTQVTTATGFATNYTTHCSFVSAVLAYQKQMFLDTAEIMNAAGLPVRLQCGEFVWWYFADHGGMAFYDHETTTNAAAALGRSLHTFLTPNDPAGSYGADIAFLAGVLDSHIRAIRSAVVAVYPTANLELLLPVDVLAPAPYGPYSVGGQLNNSVSIPATYQSPGTAPFDLLKIEALDHQVSSRDQNRARAASSYAFTAPFSWPVARYLVGLYNGGSPWATAIQEADSRVGAFTLWAFDHVCLFGWAVPEAIDTSAQVV